MTDVLMPALSPTMEEGTLAKWHVKAGDQVKSGDVIAEIETDKATMEVEAVDEGRLAGIAVRQTKSLVLLGLMLRGLVGTMGDDDNITAFSFRRLTVNVPRKRRIRVAVDGEILWMKGPLVFEVSPTPLMLLVPAPADRAQVA